MAFRQPGPSLARIFGAQKRLSGGRATEPELLTPDQPRGLYREASTCDLFSHGSIKDRGFLLPLKNGTLDA
jgi:hypothetical protein